MSFKRRVSIVNYKAIGMVPEDYKCDHCEAHGVKLWRQFQTTADQTNLLCAECAEVEGREANHKHWQSPFKKGIGKQIGLYIPAIPIEGDNTYWEIPIPEDGWAWWNSLPVNNN
jgi:hypothetical protein